LEQSESFYGHGKLLLSGEYYILDGAIGLALPTRVGQKLKVKYRPSYDPHLNWKSFGHNKDLWYEGKFEFWHFTSLDKRNCPVSSFLEKLLRQARLQNTHFLREEMDVNVETYLEFPLDWGLGASSTLIHNVAQWAYISPFELYFKTSVGSGYDVACAQAGGPILYSKSPSGPTFSPTVFNPSFKDNLFFIYLGKKQNSAESVQHYQNHAGKSEAQVKLITEITQEMIKTRDLVAFEKLVFDHEKIVSGGLDLYPIKKVRFSDYWGEVKSLGGWGGDFALVTSDRTPAETHQYFLSKGLEVFIPYEELILS